MSIKDQIPDYDLADDLVVSTPAQLRAMADPLRSTLLDLLLERAATVSELASAVGRPKSTWWTPGCSRWCAPGGCT